MPNESIDTPNAYLLELNPSTGSTQWNLSGNPLPTPQNLGGFALKTDLNRSLNSLHPTHLKSNFAQML